MLDAFRRFPKKDDTGCEHSNMDGPVGAGKNFEEFQCPKCGHLIRRTLDNLGKPTGETFVLAVIR